MRLSRSQYRQQQQNERGYVLVWFCVLLILMLLFAALAVDVGGWLLTKTRAQKAADAAALAAAPYVYSAADACLVAKEEAQRNGFDLNISNCGAPGSDVTFPGADRVSVKVRTKGDIYFANVIGLGQPSISRNAAATYNAPAYLGSNSNVLGAEPGPNKWGVGAPQGLWLSVHGPREFTYQGDLKQDDNCAATNSRSDSPPGVGGGKAPAAYSENCDPSTKTNKFYDPNGYFLRVRVENPEPGTSLAIELYDPQYFTQEEQCQSSRLNRGVFAPVFPDPRFAQAGNEYCAGDMQGSASVGGTGGTPGGINPIANRETPNARLIPNARTDSSAKLVSDYGDGGETGYMSTYFTMRAPAPDFTGTTSAPILSAKSNPNSSYFGQCGTQSYDAIGDLANRGNYGEELGSYAFYKAANFPSGGPQAYDMLQETYHNWVRFCEVNPIDGPAVQDATNPQRLKTGDYLVQVQTDARYLAQRATQGWPLPWPNTPSNRNPAQAILPGACLSKVPCGAGANNFSIRAAFFKNGSRVHTGPSYQWTDTAGVPQTARVSIFADDAMSLFQNIAAGGSDFYLTRVTPSDGDRELTVTLFDAGESSAGGGSVAFIPPDDAPPAYKTGFTCALSTTANAQLAAPGSQPEERCKITNIDTTSNGRFISAKIKLPGRPNTAGYNCTGADPDKCWWKARVNYPNQARDATTWKLELSGGPVRLVQ